MAAFSNGAPGDDDLEVMRIRLHSKWLRMAEAALWDWTRKPWNERHAGVAFHCVSELCRLWRLPPPPAVDREDLLESLRQVDEAREAWQMTYSPVANEPDAHLQRLAVTVDTDGRIVASRPLAPV
jgi:hypothetical protein